MWSLHNLDTNQIVHMLSNENYKVGRLETQVPTRKEGKEDASISRNHALFKIRHKTDNLKKPDVLPEVTLQDTKSTYGTYINENINLSRAMNHKHDFLMQPEHFIKFGKQWNHWQLKYEPLVVLTSTLPNTMAAEMAANIIKLGGHMVDTLKPECTHLTMDYIKVTLKLVCAVAKGIPIVSHTYWKAWVDAVKEGKEERPNPADFLPEVKEPTLNKNEVNFCVNPERKNLFKDLTFVVTSDKQLRRTDCIIRAAGGETVMLGSLTVTEMVKDKVIVMQHAPQDSQGQDCTVPADYVKVLEKLKKLKKRTIPESELSLAVLYNSIKTNCNTSFDHTKLIRPRKATQNTNDSPSIILAPDTADATQVLPPRDTRNHPEVTTKPQESKTKVTIPAKSTTKIPECLGETSTRSTRASKVRENPNKEASFMVPESLEIKEESIPTRVSKVIPSKESKTMIPESFEIDDDEPTQVLNTSTRANDTQEIPSKVIKKSSMMIPESMEIEESTQASTRSTRVSKMTLSSKEGPIVRKTSKMTMSQSLGGSDDNMPQSSNKPSPSIGSILTFKDVDNVFSVPKAPKNKRLGDPAPSNVQPSTKTQRLSTPEEDSQEVIVRRSLKNVTIRDHSVDKEDDDEDPFGFEDRILPSKTHYQASSSKAKPTGPKRTKDDVSDDEEASFKFKPIKIRKLIHNDDEENIFDFDDVVTDLPASAAPTQQVMSKKQTTPQQSPQETREPKTKPPSTDTSVDPGPSTSSSRDEQPVSQEDWLQTSHNRPAIKEENGTFPPEQQVRDSGDEYDMDEVDMPQRISVAVVFRPLVKLNTSVTVTTEASTSADTSVVKTFNVKTFKKSWHPQLQQLPTVISRTELKNYSSLSGELLPGVEQSEREQRTEVETETAWAFQDAVTSTTTGRKRRR